jgi:hypothetical protein
MHPWFHGRDPDFEFLWATSFSPETIAFTILDLSYL